MGSKIEPCPSKTKWLLSFKKLILEDSKYFSNKADLRSLTNLQMSYFLLSDQNYALENWSCKLSSKFSPKFVLYSVD